MIGYIDFIDQIFEYDTPKTSKRKLLKKIKEFETNVINSYEYIWRYLFSCVDIHENVIEKNIEIVEYFNLWDMIASTQKLSIKFIGKYKYDFTDINDILKYQKLSLQNIEYLAQFFSNDKERYDPFWCNVAKYYVLDSTTLEKYSNKISPSILILCQQLTEDECINKSERIKDCPQNTIWRVLCRHQILSKQTLVENIQLVDTNALAINDNINEDTELIKQVAFLKKVVPQGG